MMSVGLQLLLNSRPCLKDLKESKPKCNFFSPEITIGTQVPETSIVLVIMMIVKGNYIYKKTGGTDNTIVDYRMDFREQVLSQDIKDE